MAVTIKALLLKKEQSSYGAGLNALRNLESEMVDLSEYEAGFSDSTSTTNPAWIVKDNKVYRMCKNYFDLDKQMRVYLCKEEDNPFDIVK